MARLRVAGYPLLNDIFGGFTLEELRNCQDLTALHEIINQLINEVSIHCVSDFLL